MDSDITETGDIVKQYPKGRYVTKDVLFRCFATIRPWLDTGVLTGYLMKYGVVRNSEDMELITSPHYKPQDRMASMIGVLERSGRYGFLAFYAALNESAEESRGHADAVSEINSLVDKTSSEQNAGDDLISPPPPDDDSQLMSSPSTFCDQHISIPFEKRTGDVNIDYQIAHLEDLFCTISSSLYEEIVEKHMTTKDIIKHLVSLPFNLKRELADVIKHQISELKKSKEVDELHLQLDSKLWNFIDYYLLEHIINKVGSFELRIKMTHYVAELTEFMHKTTITSLIKFWPGRQDSPLQYDQMSIKVDLNPEECTLEKLNTIRKEFCGYFLPPLSEYAMLYYKFSKGSVLITFLFARDFIPAFIAKVCLPDCYTFFEKHDIKAATMKGILVYPLSVNRPPTRGSKSEQLGDTYYSLTKLAQEHFCIISNSSLSKLAAPSIQALQQLVHQFITYIKSEVITASHIIDAFPELPTELKLEYKSFMEHLDEGTYSLSSNERDYVKIFSLIKITLNEFGDDQLKEDMELYLRNLQNIRAMVPLQHIVDAWKNCNTGKLPMSHTVVAMKLQKDPTDFTLGDIEELRLDFANEFSNSLSGSASLVLHNVARGSTVVSWGVHRKEASVLNKELLKDSNRDFFDKYGVERIVLHNQNAFDKSNQPTVLSFLQTSNLTRISNVKTPNINIYKDGHIVQTYKHISRPQVAFCRIGKSSCNGEELDWMAKEFSYRSGRHSTIKINDKGTLVETFQSRIFRRCYYHVGMLDNDTQIIKWSGSPFYFTSGTNPSVALNNKGIVVLTFDQGIIRKEAYYRIGSVNESSGIISWHSNFTMFRSNCYNAASALNDHGVIVLSVQTYEMSFSIFVGQLNGINSIAFQSVTDPSSQYGSCIYASVALNNAGNILWLKAQQRQVFLLTGRVIQSYSSENCSLKCKLKLNLSRSLDRQLQSPSVCISHSNIIGLSYQANLPRSTSLSRRLSAVYYLTATLLREDSLELYEDSHIDFFPD